VLAFPRPEREPRLFCEMSDLNDFFAKKDRRKKKTTKLATPAVPAEVDPTSSTADSEAAPAAGISVAPSATVAPSKALKVDDGWIELDESNAAKVYTGGKTVGEFKRENDEKDTNGDDSSPTEKFIGWTRAADDGESGDGAFCILI
jgi:hypothetical protein